MRSATLFFSSVLISLLTLIVSTGFAQGDEHTKLVGRMISAEPFRAEFTSIDWKSA